MAGLDIFHLIPAKLKNSVHAIILTTLDVAEKLMLDSLLAFASGLLNVLQVNVPPSIAHFKSLPTYCKEPWTVYVIVLKKRDAVVPRYTLVWHEKSLWCIYAATAV